MIEVNNLTTNVIDGKFLKEVAERILKEENEKEGGLSIALVGQGGIRKLNKRYRGKNRATDVLAFPESTFPPERVKKKSSLKEAKEIQSLGEIIICPREVKKNAKRFKQTFEKELIRALIHGILHLLGEDHEKSKTAARKMEEKEQYYFSQTKI